MVGIDEGVPQRVIFIGKLNGGLVKDDPLLHPIVLGEVTSGNVADNDLQGYDLHPFHHGLPVAELLYEMGGNPLLLQHLHEQVGHPVVHGALPQNGPFFQSIERGGIVLVFHDAIRRVIGPKYFFGLSLVNLFQLCHLHRPL